VVRNSLPACARTDSGRGRRARWLIAAPSHRARSYLRLARLAPRRLSRRGGPRAAPRASVPVGVPEPGCPAPHSAIVARFFGAGARLLPHRNVTLPPTALHTLVVQSHHAGHSRGGERSASPASWREAAAGLCDPPSWAREARRTRYIAQWIGTGGGEHVRSAHNAGNGRLRRLIQVDQAAGRRCVWTWL
jgi:hypothetical protein